MHYRQICYSDKTTSLVKNHKRAIQSWMFLNNTGRKQSPREPSTWTAQKHFCDIYFLLWEFRVYLAVPGGLLQTFREMWGPLETLALSSWCQSTSPSSQAMLRITLFRDTKYNVLLHLTLSAGRWKIQVELSCFIFPFNFYSLHMGRYSRKVK